MKKVISGFLMGAFLATAISVYADEGLEKVEAFLRPSLPITLDGKKVVLENPPVMYDGSTYLRLRDVASLTGIEVNWNESTQTVELGTKGAKAVTDPVNTDGLKALERSIKLHDLRKETEGLNQQLTDLYNQIEPYEVIKWVQGQPPKLKEKDEFYYTTKKKMDELQTRRNELQSQIDAIIKESQAEADAYMEELKKQYFPQSAK